MKYPWAPGSVAVALAASILAGCGTVGPPVPPEFVGIGAKIQREKDKEKARAQEEKRRQELEQEPPKEPAAPPGAAEAGEEAAAEAAPEESPEEQDVALPPLRPIGTAK